MIQNQDVFDEKLIQATEIRTEIQDNYREDYKEYKKMFQSFAGDKGTVLKHIVDMYHYRNGGYPSPNSPPKHQELIQKFAQMVHYFNLIGFDELYEEELNKYGINLQIDTKFNIPDLKVVESGKEILQESALSYELSKTKNLKYAEVIKAFVLACDELQGIICAKSNIIKNQIAPVVENKCKIKKQDFKGSVTVNYRKNAGKITERGIKEIKNKFRSKVEAGTYDIKSVSEEK